MRRNRRAEVEIRKFRRGTFDRTISKFYYSAPQTQRGLEEYLRKYNKLIMLRIRILLPE